MKRILASAALAASLASPVAAQQHCAPYPVIVENAAEHFGQTPQMNALVQNGSAVIVVFANTDKGTWALFAVRPDGLACLVATGEGFEATPTPPAVPSREG